MILYWLMYSDVILMLTNGKALTQDEEVRRSREGLPVDRDCREDLVHSPLCVACSLSQQLEHYQEAPWQVQ